MFGPGASTTRMRLANGPKMGTEVHRAFQRQHGVVGRLDGAGGGTWPGPPPAACGSPPRRERRRPRAAPSDRVRSGRRDRTGARAREAPVAQCKHLEAGPSEQRVTGRPGVPAPRPNSIVAPFARCVCPGSAASGSQITPGEHVLRAARDEGLDQALSCRRCHPRQGCPACPPG